MNDVTNLNTFSRIPTPEPCACKEFVLSWRLWINAHIETDSEGKDFLLCDEIMDEDGINYECLDCGATGTGYPYGFDEIRTNFLINYGATKHNGSGFRGWLRAILFRLALKMG